MRTFPYLLALMLLLWPLHSAMAGPCETLLCMAGKLQGQAGGSACMEPIKNYFSIMRFGKRGRFDAGATAAARLNFLNGCPDAGQDNWPRRINAVYGTLR